MNFRLSLICLAAVLAAGPLAAQSRTDIQSGFALRQSQPEVPGALYIALAAAPTSDKAGVIATEIERLWRMSDSDTVALLFEHSATLQKEGRLEGALAKLDALVRLAPNAAEAWAMRGEVREALGEEEQAISDFEMAVEIEPMHYRAWAALGHLRDKRGNVKEALSAFRRAAQIYPFLEGVADRVKALEKVPAETRL